jgi:hypothetical protein
MAPAARPDFKEFHAAIPSRWAIKYRSWLRPILGRQYVDNVVTVGFYRTEASLANHEYVLKQQRSTDVDNSSLPYPPLTAEQWALLQKFTRLEEVKGWPITDDDLEHIGRIPNLRFFYGSGR